MIAIINSRYDTTKHQSRLKLKYIKLITIKCSETWIASRTGPSNRVITRTVDHLSVPS